MCTKSTLLLGNGKSFSPTILPFNPYVSFMEWEKKGQIFMFNLEIDYLLLLGQGNFRPKHMGNEQNSSCDTRIKNEDLWKFCSWKTFFN